MEEKKEKNKHGKYIRNIAIFIILIIITFRVLFKGQDIEKIFSIITTVKIEFVILGIVCMLIYFACDTINLKRTLLTLGEKVKFKTSFKYTLIGFFYSSITPAASGGQPMQIYYMHKDGIKAANSTLALVLNLFSFQVITISMALISVIFFNSYMDTGLIILFVIGITLNSMALTLLIIGIFSKRLSTWLVNFAIKIIKKLKLKNAEKLEETLISSLDKYNGSAKYIRSNRKLILRQFITTFIQEVVYYGVTYCTFCAFGFTGQSFVKIVALQSIVYATVSGIPSPGAVGVSEGAFISLFKTIFGLDIINSAMLLNRGVTFYLFVLICAVVVIINTLNMKKKENVEGETIND